MEVPDIWHAFHVPKMYAAPWIFYAAENIFILLTLCKPFYLLSSAYDDSSLWIRCKRKTYNITKLQKELNKRFGDTNDVHTIIMFKLVYFADWPT